jgi:hypothetical protein
MLHSVCLLHASVPPIETLGERFQHLDEKDWPMIQSRFDRLLRLNKLADIKTLYWSKKLADIKTSLRLNKPADVDMPQDDIFDYVCLLGRVLTIDWSPEKKKEVSAYFLKISAEMCQKPNYLDGSAPTDKEIERIGASAIDGHWFACDILFLMLRVYGRLTDFPHNNELDQILKKCDYKQPVFQRGLRSTLLLSIRGQIRFPETVTLLKDWAKTNIGWSDRDKELIASLIRLHGYMAVESDEKAWELFWNNIKPTTENEKLPQNYFRLVGENCFEIIQARSIDDPEKVFELAINANSFLEKYCYVYAAMTVVLSTEVLLTEQPEKHLKAKQFMTNKIYPIVREMSQEIQKDDKLKQLFGDLDLNRSQMEYFIDQDERARKSEAEHQALLERIKKGEPEKNNVIESRKEPTESVTTIRPEDQGEDFNPLSNSEVLKHLLTSSESAIQMKAAKVIGTRAIKGTFTPSEEEQKQINEYVNKKVLPLFKSSNPGDSGNAKDQLVRLWSLAVPVLLEAAKHKDIDIAYNALDVLILVRNEQVIRGFIALYENNEDKSLRERSIRSFGMIPAIRAPRLPYRPNSDTAEAKKLCDVLVVPFLTKILKTESDAELKEAIIESQRVLASPPVDARPKIIRIDEPSTESTTSNSNNDLTPSTPQDDKNNTIVNSDTEKPKTVKVEQEIPKRSSVLIPIAIAIVILVLFVVVWRKRFKNHHQNESSDSK